MNDRQRRLTVLARRLAHRFPVPVKSALRRLWQPVTQRATVDESAPVLSVVVVACNAESYLMDCLKSLQSQSLKRLEVFVVDGPGSALRHRATRERNWRVASSSHS